VKVVFLYHFFSKKKTNSSMTKDTTTWKRGNVLKNDEFIGVLLEKAIKEVDSHILQRQKVNTVNCTPVWYLEEGEKIAEPFMETDFCYIRREMDWERIVEVLGKREEKFDGADLTQFIAAYLNRHVCAITPACKFIWYPSEMSDYVRVLCIACGEQMCRF
jgi:hypothetical protein